MDPLTPQDPKNSTPPETTAAPEPVTAPNPVPVQEATPVPAPLPTPAPSGVVIPAPIQSGAGHVDMGKILLPKKETPGQTPLSAQRVNAGALLEQEIAAGTEGTLAQQTPEARAAAAVPEHRPAPALAAEETLVKPIETFQRDIESVVQHDNVSVLTIATAEAKRRSENGLDDPVVKKEKTRSMLLNTVFIVVGIIFLIAASGTLAYLLMRPTSVPINTAAIDSSPFISVDAVKDITVTADTSRSQVLSSLNAARQATTLSLGLIEQLVVSQSSSTPTGDVVTPMAPQQFMSLLAAHIPPDLARTIAGYLLGVHVYDGNEALLIAHVDSYQTAYAGMLSWEPFMRVDLKPLFDYTPTPRISPPLTASSSEPNQPFLQAGFVDRIVENHDARVLQNNYGDIYLLWTFINRNTLVITTNESTLHEIIARLKEAPVTPLPGH